LILEFRRTKNKHPNSSVNRVIMNLFSGFKMLLKQTKFIPRRLFLQLSV
jgi:hypothetical protein